jgi:hypothetical protein
LPALVLLASCQSGPGPRGPESTPFPYDLGSGVQQGEVTVKEGTDVEIRYKKAYQSPPQLVIVELRGAKAGERYYSKDDFQIVKQEATYFRIRNNHIENTGDSWATIKWRAEGALAPAKPVSSDADQLAGAGASQEALVERIKQVGGKVAVDPTPPRNDDVVVRVPGTEANKGPGSWIEVSLTSTTVDPRFAKNPIMAIDLHRTNVSDADVGRLAGLTSMRQLNLYGTKVTDQGLQSIAGLTNLQILYLNQTAITDAGLQYLQNLKGLSELGLNQTKITDAGLVYLRGLTNLHTLSLAETKITDQGLEQLKGLRALKRLYLVRTGVTASGVQDLKKALPHTQISK